MHVVIRSYSGQGASELFDLLGQPEEDVKSIISGVPGFVSYAAFRTEGGGVAVTVCQDKTGTDESSRRAAEWVKENVSTTVDPPATPREAPFSSSERTVHQVIGREAREPRRLGGRCSPGNGRAVY
jgi:hypothetical protein